MRPPLLKDKGIMEELNDIERFFINFLFAFMIALAGFFFGHEFGLSEGARSRSIANERLQACNKLITGN